MAEISQGHGAEEIADNVSGVDPEKFAEDDPALGAFVKIFSVPQHLVPKILGPGGSTVMMMREKYECGIAINQETREKGYSVCTVRGESDFKVASCKNEIEGIMIGGENSTDEHDHEQQVEVQHLQAESIPSMESAPRQELEIVSRVQQDLRIPQKFVGMIIGAGGQTIVKIRRHTGAEIGMQQDTANEGYSTAQISGSQYQVDKTVDVLSKMIESGRKAADGYAEYLKAVQHGSAPLSPFKPEKFPGLEFLEDEGGIPGLMAMQTKGLKGFGKGKGGKPNKGSKSSHDLSITPSICTSVGSTFVDASQHMHSDSFEVPKKYLGLLIGKQGEAIRRFRQYASEKQMAILVNQPDPDSAGTIVISGNAPADITSLKADMTQNLFKAISMLDGQAASSFLDGSSSGKSFGGGSQGNGGGGKSWGKSGKDSWGGGKRPSPYSMGGKGSSSSWGGEQQGAFGAGNAGWAGPPSARGQNGGKKSGGEDARWWADVFTQVLQKKPSQDEGSFKGSSGGQNWGPGGNGGGDWSGGGGGNFGLGGGGSSSMGGAAAWGGGGNQQQPGGGSGMDDDLTSALASLLGGNSNQQW